MTCVERITPIVKSNLKLQCYDYSDYMIIVMYIYFLKEVYLSQTKQLQMQMQIVTIIK